jgi:hypothetical protein
VPQTSPSPWVAWQSAAGEEPTGSLDGEGERRADDELSDVEIAPDPARWHRAVWARFPRRQSHDPTEWLEGNDNARFELRLTPTGEIPVHQKRRLERRVVLEEVESGQDERVAPTFRLHLDDVDDQRVARFGAADGDWTADLMDQFEVEIEERVGCRVGADLAAGDLRRLEDDGVAWVDRQRDWRVTVPTIDDGVLVEVMGLRHRVESLPLCESRWI